ncbi:MAG: hypothetical protein M1832_006236 [Thelocarpon impressellum]|nr:MAG: hypothetical protein M1832_006236 [Thelocarpon impressellum]
MRESADPPLLRAEGPARPRSPHVLVASASDPDLSLTEETLTRLGASRAIDAVAWGIIQHYDDVELRHRAAQHQLRCHRQATQRPPRSKQPALPRTTHETWDGANPLLLRPAASRGEAAHLSEWADVLVLAPIDADGVSKMLLGLADTFVLKVLRGWDVSKDILLIPGMSSATWENPMTRKQLGKIRRKWPWITVLKPMLWQRGVGEDDHVSPRWDGFGELEEALRRRVGRLRVDDDESFVPTARRSEPGQRLSVRLPPEVWSIILGHVEDWEVAKALGVYTKIPTPPEWITQSSDIRPTAVRDLEWTILTKTSTEVIALLEAGPVPNCLSWLCVKLLIKFAAVDLLSYLETHQKALFWDSFDHSVIPTKASAVFGKTEALQWWQSSPSFPTKEYTEEAMDGASKAGFVHVLEWWVNSGLPPRYTEAALEQASSKGRLDVLEWWKVKSKHQDGYHVESDCRTPLSHGAEGPLRLKVGKSICFAALSGRADVIRWWDGSGIPYSHEETVAKIASSNGHVHILELWKSLKGEKMIFDNQVLVGATKNGHADVLRWWEDGGLRVEYKTCDIEEALEDSIGVEGADRVLAWWETHGLLGVLTSEWMKVKVL